MTLPPSPRSTTMIGVIIAGARGPLFKDEEGVVWRLLLGDIDAPEPSDARVSIRGRVVADDQLEVEFVSAAGDA